MGRRMVLERLARRWIAGVRLEEALARAKAENERGVRAIIKYLGEHILYSSEVEAAKREYVELLRAISGTGIDGCISVKPTQMGLRIDRQYCRENMIELARAARDVGIFMWLDMENSKYTEDTISIYGYLLAEYREVGIAIQASLKRSSEDIRNLTKTGAKIRLVKGAYPESAEIAWTGKEDVDTKYVELMEYLFQNGDEFAIATHDYRIIKRALELNSKWNKRIEFQMLLGIRDELKQRLLEGGCNVASYIPYGETWFPYSIRRIRERKRNILLVIRSLFGG
ncbi:MAG: proline dehydrogenase family protein [Candidatus Hydrothermarchaeaceae archaeon]